MAPSYAQECAAHDAIDAVLDGRAARGELDLGEWWQGLVPTLIPVGTGLALLVWSFRIGKRRPS